jgi:NAD(P)-dependent dehydrogenase (short-subunit alcohol dehydrogenase family)
VKDSAPLGTIISTDHILVTGGNRGIGLGVAECCLINGAAQIYSIDLAEPGDEFAAIMKRFPGRIAAIQANVTDEESITAAVDKIVAESGAIHGMVVNAGRTNHKAALDFTKEDVEALFAVNVGKPKICPLGYCSLSQVLLDRKLTNQAFWCLLHSASSCSSIHQVEHQRLCGLYRFYGLLQT